MKEETTDNNAGIPFLSDIPILGNAFKHKQVKRVKNELVIMLKPTIVASDQGRMWADNIEDAQRRIRGLRTN
jgi:MSHA biogenesis protein MshL